ncbi:phospholipase D-like domain-containing protein [soil metagenome]
MSVKMMVSAIIATVLVTLLVVNFAPGEKKLQKEITHLYSVDDPQFMRSMGLLLGPSIMQGNETTELLNGDQIFPAMLASIRGAKKTVLFETYIYWSGEIGNQFADALSERARAGVKVHVLMDWIGSGKIDAALVDKMKEAGVKVERYHPLRWYNLGRMNNRTHRKLLIVDGATGYTGGVGIAELWTGHGQNPDHWRDSHYRVRGPVVAQMQSVMLDNWAKTTGTVLHGVDYFPAVAPAGTQAAQMFSSSPSDGNESMLMMYLIAITAATRSIDISSSYFVPDDMTRDALVEAVHRGVRVRLITPGPHMDAETVRRASRGLWGPLLEAGVEIHEYQPTMYHCKVMIVDGQMTSVGSTNFDMRSFRLNDEANLNVYDAAFAARQTQVFEEDLAHSARITLEGWRNRPFIDKVHEQLAARLWPLL